MSQTRPVPASRALRLLGRQGHALVALGLIALVAALVTTPAPASAQDLDEQVVELESEQERTSDQLDVATAELDDIRDRIEVLTTNLDVAGGQLGLLEDEIATLEDRAAEAQAEMFDLQARIDNGEQAMADRARSIYMHGQSTPVMELLAGNDVDTAIDRAAMVNLLSKQDQVRVEAASADRANIDAAIEQVHLVQGELVNRRQQALDLQAQMEADLDEAATLQTGLESRVATLDAREAELAAEIDEAEQAVQAAKQAAADATAEAARQSDTGSQAASAPAPSGRGGSAPSGGGGSAPSGGGGSAPAGGGGRACPMNSIPQLFNDWGWPRGGGSRSHKGNDLYGDLREPVYAMASGVWDVQSYGNSAGNWAILRGSDGFEYWYMHLDGHAVGDGTRVSVGQQVAYNGWTGNAVGSVYHVHFEIHPSGGGAIDPYPYLSQVC